MSVNAFRLDSCIQSEHWRCRSQIDNLVCMCPCHDRARARSETEESLLTRTNTERSYSQHEQAPERATTNKEGADPVSDR